MGSGPERRPVPEVHPQQARRDQSQPLAGLPVVGQHDGHDDHLPAVGVVQLLLAAAGRLVRRGHEGTDDGGVLHACSHAGDTRDTEDINVHTHVDLEPRTAPTPRLLSAEHSRIVDVSRHASFDVHPHREPVVSEAAVDLSHQVLAVPLVREHDVSGHFTPLRPKLTS